MHTPKTVLGFNGELFEPTTGHYLLGNGYRAYSPLLMIFIQPDSWSPFGAGGLNAYAYCKGDPVNAADPTGHMPFPSSRPWNFRWIQPPPSPNHSRPGSPFTASMQDFPLLDNFPEQPVMVPAAVVGSSPTGLAPAAVSPSRPPSPFPQSSPLASTSSTALASSGAHTEALPPIMGARNRLKQGAVDRRNKIVNNLPGMIKSRNTQAILELSKENRSKSAVLKELYRLLPLSARERAVTMDTQHGTPMLRKFHLDWLVARARAAGNKKDMRFYRSLRKVTADPRHNGASRR
ncbi:RHS repeat-associated core domain-containing protein [Pseudomonas putida CSV86]|uniref:RHS repeat-associated core domain-containing protein n=1 Tax=Pseudomonas bharatica CSV86 TaxID=1005395 RepID=A0A7K4EL75_9PSED|nr:RHS repeat-associated core domain-containing protein [Pseudomonas bharatica]NNJ18091.1 RHS repeat-associated core domain-containing protein [Pseudomonas bharatica CSV86]